LSPWGLALHSRGGRRVRLGVLSGVQAGVRTVVPPVVPLGDHWVTTGVYHRGVPHVGRVRCCVKRCLRSLTYGVSRACRTVCQELTYGASYGLSGRFPGGDCASCSCPMSYPRGDERRTHRYVLRCVLRYVLRYVRSERPRRMAVKAWRKPRFRPGILPYQINDRLSRFSGLGAVRSSGSGETDSICGFRREMGPGRLRAGIVVPPTPNLPEHFLMVRQHAIPPHQAQR